MTAECRFSVFWPLSAVLVFVMFLSGFQHGRTQESADEFTRLKALFNERVSELETRVDGEKAAMLQSYAKVLGNLQEKFQTNGDLDVVLIIRKEIEATRSGTLSVIETPESLPPALRRPREIASEELERRNGEMAESLADLKSKYVDALRGMKKAYTKAGKIELAIAIASEIEAYGAEGDLAENGAPRTLAQLPEDLQSGLTAWFPLDEDGVVEVKDLGKRGWLAN